jgi:enamine deaminase RidA (YjgF/YER057c/UK114 family)
MKKLQPPGWERPKGYSNGVVAQGRMVFVSGQIGWDETGTFVSGDLVGQIRQCLRNTLAILAEAGAGPEHVVRMTWYITDRSALMGRHFPAMSVVEVSALMEAEAVVEIESTAVIPTHET